MKIETIAVLTVLALTAVGNTGAAAQTVDYETVMRAIERTDEVIAEARLIIAESRSQIARVSLDRSVELQARAKSFADAMRHGFAYKYTIQAREEAWHAIALARADAKIEERLANLTEHTREKLIRLNERIQDSGVRDERLMRLILEARSLLDNSHMNALQLRNQLAVNLAENARQVTERAEERFRKVLNLKEICERRLMLMERLLIRAGEYAEEENGETFQARLQQATRLAESARNHIGMGRYDAARMEIERCEQLLRGLVRRTPSGGDAVPVSNALAAVERLLEGAREMIEESPEIPQAVFDMVDRAGAMIERARTAAAEGDAREAMGIIHQARALLRLALDSGAGEMSRERIEARIHTAVQRQSAIRQMLQQCTAEGARNLFERANRHLDMAMEHFENGRLERALAEARITNNMYERIREICATL
jgi:hypothetical protein